MWYKGTIITVYACRHVCLFSIDTYRVLNKLLVNTLKFQLLLFFKAIAPNWQIQMQLAADS